MGFGIFQGYFFLLKHILLNFILKAFFYLILSLHVEFPPRFHSFFSPPGKLLQNFLGRLNHGQ